MSRSDSDFTRVAAPIQYSCPTAVSTAAKKSSCLVTVMASPRTRSRSRKSSRIIGENLARVRRDERDVLLVLQHQAERGAQSLGGVGTLGHEGLRSLRPGNGLGDAGLLQRAEGTDDVHRMHEPGRRPRAEPGRLSLDDRA